MRRSNAPQPKMELPQTNGNLGSAPVSGTVRRVSRRTSSVSVLSKLRRSEIFVENRSNQDSKLRRSGIFHQRAEDAAPTELKNSWLALATKMSPLRGWANFLQPFRLL